MKLSTSLVAVRKINSKVERSNFSDKDLNQAAELILKAEGIINPLVLRKTNQDSYEVVNGDFEYYAAAKAKERDPRKGEMIGAFIIEPEYEDVLQEQVKALRERDTQTDKTGKSETDTDKTKQIQGLLQQLDKASQEVEALKKNIEQVAESVKGFKNALNVKIEAIRHELNLILPPKKLDLMTAPQKEVIDALKLVKVNKTRADAAWEAIKHLKAKGRELTGENFEKLIKAKSGEDKIKGFADGTYKKLKEIANIPD